MAQHGDCAAGHGLSDWRHAGRTHGRLAADTPWLALGLCVRRPGHGADGAHRAVAPAGVGGFPDGPSPGACAGKAQPPDGTHGDRKSTRLNSSHLVISYAVFCLKKKKKREHADARLTAW